MTNSAQKEFNKAIPINDTQGEIYLAELGINTLEFRSEYKVCWHNPTNEIWLKIYDLFDTSSAAGIYKINIITGKVKTDFFELQSYYQNKYNLFIYIDYGCRHDRLMVGLDVCSGMKAYQELGANRAGFGLISVINRIYPWRVANSRVFNAVSDIIIVPNFRGAEIVRAEQIVKSFSKKPVNSFICSPRVYGHDWLNIAQEDIGIIKRNFDILFPIE